MTICPCSEDSFEKCCKHFVEGTIEVDSPLKLMRSRYTAFSRGLVNYLYETSSTSLQQQINKVDLAETCKLTSFVKLEIIGVSAVDETFTKLSSDINCVEFKAHYIDKFGYGIIHERSNFIYEHNGWKYDTGTQFDVPPKPLKRNDLCPCESGKKFKKCHLTKV